MVTHTARVSVRNARGIVVRATRVVGVVMTLTIGLFLLMDATTFALMAADPATGRPSGCFTAVELMLGITEPNGVREIEWLASIGMLLALPVSGVRALARRLRRPGIDRAPI